MEQVPSSKESIDVIQYTQPDIALIPKKIKDKADFQAPLSPIP